MAFKQTLKSAKTSGSVVFFFAVTFVPFCINCATNESRLAPLSTFNELTAWLLALAFLNCSVNSLRDCAFSEKLRVVTCKTLRRMRYVSGRNPLNHNPHSQCSLQAVNKAGKLVEWKFQVLSTFFNFFLWIK